MTEIAEELRECPFCGGAGKYLYREVPLSKWRHRIECASTTCGMEGPVEASKADTIAAWNTRPDDRLKARNAELEAGLSRLERYASMETMDRLIQEDGRTVGWEKSWVFSRLLDDVRAILTLPAAPAKEEDNG